MMRKLRLPLSLLCCFACILLQQTHLLADTSDTFQVPESSVQTQSRAQLPASIENGQRDILDIYGPVPLPAPVPYHLYVAGLLLGALALFVLFRLRNRFKKQNVIHIDHVGKALTALKQAEKLHDSIDIRHYCNEVSCILKTFLEETSGQRITSRTTAEFITAISAGKSRETGQLSDHQTQNNTETLLQCLMVCDKAKFARFHPDSEEITALGAKARSFIEATAAHNRQGD